MQKKNKAISQPLSNGVLYAFSVIVVIFFMNLLGVSTLLTSPLIYLLKPIQSPWVLTAYSCFCQIVIIAGVSFIVTLMLNSFSHRNTRGSIRLATLIYLIYMYLVEVLRIMGTSFSITSEVAQALLWMFIAPVLSFYIFGRLFNR